MSRWLSSEGFEVRASRIFALSWLTVVDAGRWGKVKGLATPEDGDTTTRVKSSGSGCFSALAGPPACSRAPAGRDIVVGVEDPSAGGEKLADLRKEELKWWGIKAT
jgi:hypothetical protein